MKVTVDPRPARIRVELSNRSAIIVLGVKGGVGKTTIAALLGAALRGLGKSPLLIDVDVTDPNMHVVLGVDPELVKPGESKGIEPINVSGIGFLSIAPYAGRRPLPLRGDEAVNAVRELLAATDYTGYDTIVIDTPPGMGDVPLELMNLLPHAKRVVVTTPSKLSLDSLDRLILLLNEARLPPHAIVFNMVKGGKPGSQLGGHVVRYDENLEEAMGSLQALTSTKAFEDVKPLAGLLA